MRARENFIFLTFCFGLCLGLLQAYRGFQNYFSPENELTLAVSQYEEELEREKLRTALLESQMVDYQIQVAAFLPNSLLNLEGYLGHQLRSLASVSRKPIEGLDLSTSILERGKEAFKRSDYKEAITQFKRVQALYPTSPETVEASFFLGEAHFLLGQYQECLDTVDTMMLHFPGHELTGLMMLRMGQIFQMRNRYDESKEVYASVKRAFRENRDIVLQADTLLISTE